MSVVARHLCDRSVALTVLALMTAVAGCRTGRAILAPPEEYASFRSTRTRATLEERMHAAEDYLARYPQGSFNGEVRRAYLRAEEALWASKHGSVAGLSSYLETLPTGPHAKVARRELDAKRAARVDLLGRGAANTEGRLAAAAAARTRAREALGTWVRRMSDPALYEGTMAAAPSDVVVAWSLGLPQPKCGRRDDGGRSCTKLVTETFEIPRDGEREMVLEVAVDERPDGRVCKVALRGPSLFARWEEASSLVAQDRDVEARKALLNTVGSLVRATIDSRPGATACDSDSTASGPFGWAFQCGAMRIDAATSAEPGGDDAIVLSTASTCSSP